MLPEATRATARQVIGRVLDRLHDQLADRTRAAVSGALSRATRTRRPRPADIDWNRTIRANLRHWLPEQGTLVPEHLVGYGRHHPALAREVVIALDQSGSMTDSIVHASLFACVLARLPALRTSLVAFDTAAVDLSHLLDDPVDVLFGVQLGGGTDIANALGVCQRMVTRPRDTVLVLISDLFEGGDAALMRSRVAALVRAGVSVLVLLALSDDGAPAADQHHAAELAALGAYVTACTPAEFPDLLGAVLEHRVPSGAVGEVSPVRPPS